MYAVRTLVLAALLLFPLLALAAKVNINTADAATLQTLNGVGPAKAEAIVKYRNSHGAFSRAEGLSAVKGIGAKTVEDNRERITVE